MTHAHGEGENVSGVGREGRHKLVTSRGNKLEQKEGKIANKLLWNTEVYNTPSLLKK